MRELCAQVFLICDIRIPSPLSNKMTISKILVKTWSTTPKSAGTTKPKIGPKIMPSIISGKTSGIRVLTNNAENKWAKNTNAANDIITPSIMIYDRNCRNLMQFIYDNPNTINCPVIDFLCLWVIIYIVINGILY